MLPWKRNKHETMWKVVNEQYCQRPVKPADWQLLGFRQDTTQVVKPVISSSVRHGVWLGTGHGQFAGDRGTSCRSDRRRVNSDRDASVLASSHLLFGLADVERTVVDRHCERHGRVERVAEVDGCCGAWLQHQRSLTSRRQYTHSSQLRHYTRNHSAISLACLHAVAVTACSPMIWQDASRCVFKTTEASTIEKMVISAALPLEVTRPASTHLYSLRDFCRHWFV